MANSSRKIVRGVRVGNKTYTAGMEDELAKVLPAASVPRLLAKGHIEGAWVSPPNPIASEEIPQDTRRGEDLSGLTVAELKDRARDAEIEGFSTMNKADLVEALSGTKE